MLLIRVAILGSSANKLTAAVEHLASWETAITRSSAGLVLDQLMKLPILAEQHLTVTAGISASVKSSLSLTRKMLTVS